MGKGRVVIASVSVLLSCDRDLEQYLLLLLVERCAKETGKYREGKEVEGGMVRKVQKRQTK